MPTFGFVGIHMMQTSGTEPRGHTQFCSYVRPGESGSGIPGSWILIVDGTKKCWMADIRSETWVTERSGDMG